MCCALSPVVPSLRAQTPAPQPTTTSDTSDETSEALRRVAEALARDTSLSPDLREALADLVGALEQERAAPHRALAADLQRLTLRADEQDRLLGSLAQVVESLNVYGDLRLRHETDTSRDNAPARNRERMRLRVGANVAVNEEFEVGLRLVTGDRRDPNSTHQTLGTVFDSNEVSIDRAYLDYHPLSQPQLWIRAGKFAHPFRSNPVYGELVWDADVQPEGVAMGYRAADTAGFQRLDFVAGEYIILEQNAGDEASAFVAQVSGQTSLAPAWDLTTALGYSRYSHLSPDGSAAVVGDNGGNALAANGDFASRFSLVNPLVTVTHTGLERPLTFSGEYVSNTRAKGPLGTGWAVGTAYGQTRDQDDWRVYYQYQDIEQDAVLTPFAQDDFLRMSHFRGHLAGWQYQVRRDVQLHLWGLVTTRKTGIPTAATERNHQWRLRADLNIKF